MQQQRFTACDPHEVITVTLGRQGRLAAIELSAGWQNHLEAEELAATINAVLAQARLDQLLRDGTATAPAPADDGRLDQIVQNWQRYTSADAEAAEAEMWAALNALEKSLAAPAAPPQVVRLTNAVRNVSMAWDGLMLADLVIDERVAERPAGWFNESFAEIIAQTEPEEQTDGIE